MLANSLSPCHLPCPLVHPPPPSPPQPHHCFIVSPARLVFAYGMEIFLRTEVAGPNGAIEGQVIVIKVKRMKMQSNRTEYNHIPRGKHYNTQNKTSRSLTHPYHMCVWVCVFSCYFFFFSLLTSSNILHKSFCSPAPCTVSLAFQRVHFPATASGSHLCVGRAR